MKLSIHTKVMGIAFFFLIVLFAMVWYLNGDIETEAVDARLGLKGEYVARIVSLLTDRLLATNDVDAYKLALDHVMLSDDDREIASLRVRLQGRELMLVVNSTAISPVRSFTRSFPLNSASGRQLGQLEIGFWEREYLPGSSQVFLLNTVIAVDIVVLGGLLLHFTLRNIVTRPLEHFVEATRKVAFGEFFEPVKITGGTAEEDGLARSFNEMLTQVNASREQLQRINAELEERVVQRTAELRKAKVFAETVIASAADGLYSVDENKTLTFFNKAAESLTGLQAGLVLGQKCYAVLGYPFCKSDCLLERIHRAGKGGASGSEEYIEELQSGGKMWAISGAVFDEPSGHFSGGVEGIKDLSHSKKLQQQLRQLDKITSLGTLSAGIAHELNNPLSNIKIFAHILGEELDKKDGDSQDHSRQSLKSIQEQTDRATAIVRKLLDFARETRPELEQVDIDETVQHGLEMVRYMLEMKRIKIELDLEPHLPRVKASKVGLQQVIINLLNNARQAMKDGGVLRIRTWAEKSTGKVCFSVADSGTGIPEEHLARIFDPFFTTKAVGDGTGLGLSITYGIVKDHRGEISVESKPGVGSTFTIALPLGEGSASVN